MTTYRFARLEDVDASAAQAAAQAAQDAQAAAEAAAAAAGNPRWGLEESSGFLQLTNDEASPAAWKVYGVDGSGVRGWRDPHVTVGQIEASGTPGPSTFLRGDGEWVTVPGDMLASVYDPNGHATDAFAFANMTGTVSIAQLGASGTPSNTTFLRGDGVWAPGGGGGGGSGDMSSAVYDPNGIEADVFDMDNMVEGTNTKIMTAAERTAIAGLSSTYQPLDGDLTSIAALSTASYGRSLLTLANAAALAAEVDAYFLTPAEGNAAYQPLDSDLTSIAALATTTYGRGLLTLANQAALIAEVASAYQPLDSDLTAIAALTTTSFGRSFLDRADAAAGRTLLGLGTAATQNTGTSGANVPLLNGANTWSADQTLSAKLWQGGISAAAQGTNLSGFASSTAGASLVVENTSASGSGGGGGFLAYSNDGAAMASGDRLGFFIFGGSSSASSIRNTAGVAGFASQAWVDASAYGTRLEFLTTANGSTSRTTKLILGNSGLLVFGATEANSVPALKPSSAVLQVRLGDDSDYAALSIKSLTVSDAPTTRSNLGLAFGTNIREVLTADRTYYVLTTGSDTNNGLTNTSGGAFATLTKALAVAATIDLNGFTLTIQIGAGTFTGYYLIPALVGQGDVSKFVINGVGNTTILDGSTGQYTGCIDVIGRSLCTISNLKVQNNSTNGVGCRMASGGYLTLGSGVELGACGYAHFNVQGSGALSAGVGHTVSGNATVWLDLSSGAFAYIAGTVAFGTRTFSTCTVNAQMGGITQLNATFTGTVTGKRYNAITGGGIQTFGAGASYIPGNSAGTATSPGWYA